MMWGCPGPQNGAAAPRDPVDDHRFIDEAEIKDEYT